MDHIERLFDANDTGDRQPITGGVSDHGRWATGKHPYDEIIKVPSLSRYQTNRVAGHTTAGSPANLINHPNFVVFLASGLGGCRVFLSGQDVM
jgi:hypothetical protein